MKLFYNIYVLITLLLGIGFSQIQAKIEDHFKKVLGKTSISKMGDIDFIYMINLDQRPEKFQACLDLLLPYGIN
ncbi:MAG: hypothetical protein JSS09_00850, partial [Verrucomicrobia bacterium]|nr:hypothetical protein [Verrucomicrobiota bacterium]